MEELILFTRDLGPGVYGIAMNLGGKLVCVVSPDVLREHDAQRAVRELLRRQGMDIAPTDPHVQTQDAA